MEKGQRKDPTEFAYQKKKTRSTWISMRMSASGNGDLETAILMEKLEKIYKKSSWRRKVLKPVQK